MVAGKKRIALIGVGLAGVVAIILALVFTAQLASKLWTRLSSVGARLEQVEARLRYMSRNVAGKAVEHQAMRGDAALPTDKAEFARVAEGHWVRLAGGGEKGSWKGASYVKTRALAVHGDLLCTGFLGVAAGGAEVWCLDEKWVQIGGGGANGSWSGGLYVTHLTSFSGDLYAGVDHEIWRYRAGQWTLIGSVGKGCTAHAGAVHAGTLYVGSAGCGAQLYRLQEDRLVRADALDGDRYSGIFALHSHKAMLFIGASANFGTAGVFRYGPEGAQQVGGDGKKGSWINPGFYYLESFASFGDSLLVTMNRKPLVAMKLTSVWAYDGREWRPVGRAKMPAQWRRVSEFTSSAVFNGVFVVGGGGGQWVGDAGVWALSDRGDFFQIGGHGVNGSWGRNGKAMSNGPGEYVHRMEVWRNMLVAGFGDGAGMAQIWAYRPSK